MTAGLRIKLHIIAKSCFPTSNATNLTFVLDRRKKEGTQFVFRQQHIETCVCWAAWRGDGLRGMSNGKKRVWFWSISIWTANWSFWVFLNCLINSSHHFRIKLLFSSQRQKVAEGHKWWVQKSPPRRPITKEKNHPRSFRPPNLPTISYGRHWGA